VTWRAINYWRKVASVLADEKEQMKKETGNMGDKADTKKAWRERAEKLWQLLDNIDTLDDSCKDSDAAYRNHSRKYLRARFEILTSDGYDLYLPGDEPPMQGKVAPTDD